MLIILWRPVSVDLQTSKPPPGSVQVIQTPPPTKPRKRIPAQTTYTPPQVNVRPQDTSIKIVPDKTVAQIGELVTFRLEPQALVDRVPYSFEFDFHEGSREPLDRVKKFVQHRFTSSGDHSVSAFAIPQPGVGPDEEGIDPITIRVRQVTLSAKPLSTEVGIPVSFIATSISKDPRLRFRFLFGDGKQTDWQTSVEASHPYLVAGPYKPKVELGFADNKSATTVSDSNFSAEVNVNPPSPQSLRFRAEPRRVKTDEIVTFSATFPASERHIQYRFDYGDGQASEWQDEGMITHAYSVADTYEPSVEVRGLIDTTDYPLIKSTPARIAVIPGPVTGASPVQVPSPEFRPTPTKPPWPPWVIPSLIFLAVVTALAFLTVVVVGGYQLAKWAFTPKPTFVSHVDVGSAATDHSGPTPLIDFELHLDPNMRNGVYSLLPNGPGLIGAERSHQ